MSASRREFISTKKQQAPVIPKRDVSGPIQRFLIAYATRHLQAALLSLGQISRAPLTTLMVCVVMGIALALPTSLFVLLKNISSFNQYWDSRSPVVLYLKMPSTDTAAETLAQQIQARPDVEKVAYISPTVGLTEFQKQSNYGNALNALKENPLPAVLIVTPKPDAQTPNSITALRDALQALPQVDMAKLDLDWVQRLDALLTLGEKVIYALAIILCLGVMLIVGSTIHLALQSHHDEIQVYKLVGATAGFIRRPFLYRGVIYGLVASIFAWTMVNIMLAWLEAPVVALAKLYGSAFVLQGLGSQGICVLLLGVALGWLGAWVAVYRHNAAFV